MAKEYKLPVDADNDPPFDDVPPRKEIDKPVEVDAGESYPINESDVITQEDLDNQAPPLTVGTADYLEKLKEHDPSFDAWMSGMVASTSENIAEMELRVQDEVFILPQIALAGQITAIHASYNVGKTLLTCWLLANRDKEATEGRDIYYVNADDTFTGSIEKMKLLDPHGVKTLIPNEKGFKVEMLGMIMARAISEKKAGNVTIILDTLKKFVNLMDKNAVRDLTGLIREFVIAGGAVVALAHVNKMKGSDGKGIVEGVGDLMNDADCGYVIELVSDGEEKTVAFENNKLRGTNSLKVTFQYDNHEGASWMDRYDSIELIDTAEAKRRAAAMENDSLYEDHQPAIKFILNLLAGGDKSKTEIIRVDNGNGITRAIRTAVLEKYNQSNPEEERRLWATSTGEKGGIVYSLPDGLFDDLSE